VTEIKLSMKCDLTPPTYSSIIQIDQLKVNPGNGLLAT